MNILMIGHSGSGKTTYMGGLYKLYGDDPNGFGLWTGDSGKRSRLQELSNRVASGKYPSGTDIAEEYNFWLQYDNKLLIPFNWFDYRGGALSESSKYSKDAEELIRRIENADALIVFLDGAKIVNMTEDDLEDEYETLVWCIQKAISKRAVDSHYFPVSFVITKGDLYDRYDTLINSPGLNYFMPIVETIAKSKVSAGMIGVIEVSSTGMFNIPAPLMFSLYYGMHHYIAERVRNINSEVDRYNSLDPGVFDDIFSTVFGVDSDRKKAQKCIEKVEEEKSRLEMLESLGKILEEYLADLEKKGHILKF